MPRYPTPSAYQEAIQFPATAFADPDLQTAEPRAGVLGLPQPVTGAFAAVFPLTGRAGQRWAAKCFLTDVPGQRQRYAAVADHLARTDLACTVGFDYQPRGITVEGAAFPLLKMDWAEGTPLNRFVADHLDAPAVLTALADAWAVLLADLDAADVAHGDLQHGNVLVQRDAFAEQDDARQAAPAPTLTLVDYDTVYVPALAGRPSAEVGHRHYQHPDRTDADFGLHLDRFPGLAVYTALQALARRPALWDRFDTDENVLFRDADFYDPEASVLFAELAQIDDVAPLAEALRRACYVAPEAVPRLADVLRGEALRGEAPASRPAVAAGRPRRAARRDMARTGLARWFLPAALAACALAVGAGLAVGWTWGLGVVGAGLLAGTVAVARGYRRLPLVRRRRRLRQEEAHFAGVVDGLRRQVVALERRRTEARATLDARRAERLEELREAARYDHLKHHFIGEARAVEGISHKVVVRLKVEGIRTAYEAKPERVDAVRLISDAARTRLKQWRAALLAEIAGDLPDALSPAEERRLRRYVARQVEELDAERARAERKIRVQEEERARLAARRADLPRLTPGAYVRYLLRLAPLPSVADAPPAPPPAHDDAPTAAADTPALPPPPADDDDRPWWEQHG
jgi:hypothetical protein